MINSHPLLDPMDQVILRGNAVTVSLINVISLGKSNLMDAISFVLGVNSNQLRSDHLVDLINRRSDSEIAKPVATNNKKRSAVVKEQGATKTIVSAYYLRNENEELIFSRR